LTKVLIYDAWKESAVASKGKLWIHAACRFFPGHTTTPAVNLWFTSTPVVVGDSSPVLPPPVEPGYRSVKSETDGKTSIWRILYTHDIENQYWHAVAVDLGNMDYFGVITLRQLLLPLLILMPVKLAFLVWGVNNGLRPLHALAQKIHSRSPSQLEPIISPKVSRK
jgi:hypothetical protein